MHMRGLVEQVLSNAITQETTSDTIATPIVMSRTTRLMEMTDSAASSDGANYARLR